MSLLLHAVDQQECPFLIFFLLSNHLHFLSRIEDHISNDLDIGAVKRPRGSCVQNNSGFCNSEMFFLLLCKKWKVITIISKRRRRGSRRGVIASSKCHQDKASADNTKNTIGDGGSTAL